MFIIRKCSQICVTGPHYENKVYKRKLKIIGANAWDKPNKPVAPRL